MKVIKYSSVPNIDSATAMIQAVSGSMKNVPFANVGGLPHPMSPIASRLGNALNRLPARTRRALYTGAGAGEALSPRKLKNYHFDKLASWVTSIYPKRKYRAVTIGSGTGATVHLSAALDIPHLPQTFLAAVRKKGVDPNDPQATMAWALEPARDLLGQSDIVELHHMLDPVQDLLMSQVIAYFRFKWLKMPESYKTFLLESLEPGATVYILNCTLKWPATTVEPRHFFQFGAPGGAEIRQYFEDDPAVREFLQYNQADRERWSAPKPDTSATEAEWGFAPPLADDIAGFCREHGFKAKMIEFAEPEDLSPFTADLYRDWYRKRGIPDQRIVGETFVFFDPLTIMSIGAVPFWMLFPIRSSAQRFRKYLESTEPFDEIGVTLFSYGIKSIGQASIEEWESILHMARKSGVFVGVDTDRYPRDLASLFNYHTDLQKKFKSRWPHPGPITLEYLEEFARQKKYNFTLSGL